MANDMTKGPILKTLIFFTIPLVLGNLLQLTYNTIDSIIVGQYVGKEALAAVGTANPIMTLILLFTNGICLGAGILVSFYYGAKRYDTLKKQVSTGMIFGSIFTLCMSGIICLFARQFLGLLQVEKAILDLCAQYLRIVMISMIFSYIYNYLASILRALGDSRSPLYFLAISSILNIFGDLLFVVKFQMGVNGAAYSTACCEAISALCCWIYMTKKVKVLNLGQHWFDFDWHLLGKTLSYGIVSALQQSSIQIGKLVTQGMVNTLGVNATAAFNATNRADDFAILPEQNIAHGMTSIMAQNIGAAKDERARQTFLDGMGVSIVYGIVVGGLLYFGAEGIMRLFTNDLDVIVEGMKYLHIIAYIYTLPGITNALQGYFRGIGDLKITLWSTIMNMSGRCVSCYILMFHFHFGFEAIPWSYLIGWILMILFEAPFIFFGKKNYFQTNKI